jgi:hypothetical protein
MRSLVLALLAALCLQGVAAATTYPPVSFTELVERADVIFVGDVVDARPFPLDTRDGRVIKTRVIFRVVDPLLGTAASVEVFDFLGGDLGADSLRVAEMPRFAAGERVVVFARRERSINPIVGFTQGLLRVTRDGTGVERVLTADGFALPRTQDIGVASLRRSRVRAAAMRLPDFQARVRQALGEAGRR